MPLTLSSSSHILSIELKASRDLDQTVDSIRLVSPQNILADWKHFLSQQSSGKDENLRRNSLSPKRVQTIDEFSKKNYSSIAEHDEMLQFGPTVISNLGTNRRVLDWHSELELAVLTLDAFCIVDRGNIRNDD